jgi:uncharacterized FlaG/YvyC family protein
MGYTNAIPPLVLPMEKTPAATGPTAREARALRYSVESAVRLLNNVQAVGEGREVTYSVDPQSRKPVVRVIESETKDVITQWPAEYALALAAENPHTRDSG